MLTILNIQTIIKAAFIILIVAPLPVILLSSPFAYLWEFILQKRYYNKVRKHFAHPESISVEQLQQVFPNMKTVELNQIAYYLKPESTYKDN